MAWSYLEGRPFLLDMMFPEQFPKGGANNSHSQCINPQTYYYIRLTC